MIGRTVHIYVEGKGDLIFLCQLLEARFGIKFEKKYTDLSVKSIDFGINIKVEAIDIDGGGISSKAIRGLMSEIKDTLMPKGIESLIFLDADTKDHTSPPGGFKDRSLYIDDNFKDVSFDYFLLPNHDSEGNLENLLNLIISDSGKDFYSKCLSNYVSCISNLENKPAYVIDKDFEKMKMEWYTFLMLGKKANNKNTGAERNYLNNNLWDLKSNSLDPICEFISTKLNIMEIQETTTTA